MVTTKTVVETCSLPLPERPNSLPENEQQLYDKVLAHFQNTPYTLPGENDEAEASDITQDEKRWLVRCFLLLGAVLILTLVLLPWSRQKRHCCDICGHQSGIQM